MPTYQFYMVFENLQIETSQLPTVQEIAFKQLAPAYKTVEYIGTCILFGILFIGAVFLFFTSSPVLGVYRYGVFIFWIFLFTLSMYLVDKRYQMAGYALREHDVIYQQGVWWQTTTAIPFNRMQHCEISQGPIQNAFKLATLRIFTAGGSNSDLSIDGLDFEEAKLIKDFITGKISGQLFSVDSEQGAVGSEQLAMGSGQEENTGGAGNSSSGTDFTKDLFS
ncbi:MAG: PH domain-containing protein [Saprospiraceae bacterium]